MLLIFTNKFFYQNFILFDKLIYINSLAVGGIVIGSIGVTIIVIQQLFPYVTLPSINYLYYIYLLLAVLTPILILLISFGIPIKILLSRLSEKFFFHLSDGVAEYISISRKRSFIYLSLILITSILIPLVPHILTNDENPIIGDDTLEYVRLISLLYKSNNVYDIVNQAFTVFTAGDRGLSLIIFFSYTLIFGSLWENTIDFLPVFLSPTLVLVIYYLSIELTSNRVLALFASFLTAISFHTLIGTYAGLYSNWFALCFAYLSIIFLFRSLNNPKIRYLVTFSILLVILLFSHSPTWVIFLTVISIFLIYTSLFHIYNKKFIILAFLALSPSIIVDIIRLFLIDKSGITQGIYFAHAQGIGIDNLLLIWKNLVETSQIYLAGLFSNGIIFLLALYWLFLSNIKEKNTVFLLIFCSILLIPIIIGEPVTQSRILFEIPLQIPVAIALMHIKRNNGNLIVFAILFWLMSISIRSLSNFDFNTLSSS